MHGHKGRSVGSVIRTRRAQRGMSLKQLADRLRVSSAHLSLIESGDRMPSPELLARLAEELAYPVEELEMLAGRVPDELQPALAARIPEVALMLRDWEETERGARILPPATDLPRPTAEGHLHAPVRREPFSGDLVVGKNSVIYQAHSYHTKVPVEAITPLILHYTQPGEITVDPFCGSGMTGVAAIRAGRHAILSDLSPAAVHIASNYCTPCDESALTAAASRVLDQVQPTMAWLYDASDGAGVIEYTVWSDVFRCPQCGATATFWESTYDAAQNVLRPVSTCPTCTADYRKDEATWVGEQPVLVNIAPSGSAKRRRIQRPPTERELAHLAEVQQMPVPFWYPRAQFTREREMWRASHEAMGIDTVDKFYSRRNLYALASLRHRILDEPDDRLLRALMFAFTGCVNRASRRYQWNAKRPTNVMTGTLYVASLRYEFNVLSLFMRKVRAACRYFAELGQPAGRAAVRLSSATELDWIPEASADYLFTDPPFGSNIYYADSSLLWEAWLDNYTDERLETVVNRKRPQAAGGKDITEYQRLMTVSFAEACRVLKPGRNGSIVFNNTDHRVWRAIQDAIGDAGFAIQSTSGLDKTHRSIKGVRGDQRKEEIALFDVVVNVERPATFRGVTPPSIDQNVDTLLLETFRQHLTQTGSDSTNASQRRTEYLHSRAVRTLLEHGISIRSLSFQEVERVAVQVADQCEGEWILRQPDRQTAHPTLASPYGALMEHDLSDVSAFVAAHRRNNSGQPVPAANHLVPQDIAGRRNTPVYNAHSYPTKVPPEAIIPFIQHFTEPGDLILDPFSGSGMTGLAAALTGRLSILNDLSPLAAHLAFNHTNPCSASLLATTFDRLYEQLRPEFEQLYWAEPLGIDQGALAGAGYVHYTLWSLLYECPTCHRSFTFWEAAVDQVTRQVQATFPCPHCGATLRKGSLRRLGSEPVLLSLQLPDGSRIERVPTASDRAHIVATESEPVLDWYPDVPFSEDREMYIRSALHLQGITRVSDFYTRRNLRALARILKAITEVADYRIRRALHFAFTNTAWHGTRMRRYNALGGQRPLTGTLYIPQLSSEVNVLEVMRNKIRQLVSFYASYRPPEPFVPPAIRVGSATALAEIPDNSIDYAFFDPPFGSNIFYSDLNLILESWLGALTDPTEEAVVNRSLPPRRGGKTLNDYQQLMTAALRETHRVLKPGRHASVIFHNTDPLVWQAFQDAAADAGFDVAGTTALNRSEFSMKGYKGLSDSEDVAHHDVIINLHRQPSGSVPNARATLAESQIVTVLSNYLADPGGPGRPRTTQYLHSLALRFAVGGGYDSSQLSYQHIRDLCQHHFRRERDGWHLRSPATP